MSGEADGATIRAARVAGRVEARIRSYTGTRAVVAVSGGVDSAVVLALAARVFGPEEVLAVTAVSPSYPAGELDAARSLAAGLGVRHRTVRTGEVGREAYARNDPNRCFHCKAELYATLQRLAFMAGPGEAPILAGANADDALDFRPGLWAASLRGIRNPLLEEGVGKQRVRSLARMLGLAVADKPALACLASRVAYGIRITPSLLARIDRAERAVRALGFEQVRVRHRGHEATIEVRPPDVERLMSDPNLPDVLVKVRAMGWDAVSVDPRGYRSGSLNEGLSLEAMEGRRHQEARS